MPDISGYVASIVVITAGYALFQTADDTAVMAGIRQDRRGLVAGMLNLSRDLGPITGTSVMGAVFPPVSERIVVAATTRISSLFLLVLFVLEPKVGDRRSALVVERDEHRPTGAFVTFRGFPVELPVAAPLILQTRSPGGGFHDGGAGIAGRSEAASGPASQRARRPASPAARRRQPC